MTVLLNNEAFATEDLAPDVTVAGVLAAAQCRLEGTGSVIVALRHNNEDIPAGRLEQMLSEPASHFENLELVTGRPGHVVLDALEQVRPAFAETFAAVQEAADALAAGKLPEAMTTLSGCVAVWGRTHQSILQGGALLGVRFDGLEIVGRPIAEWLHELATKLHQLKDAIEARDSVLLGDILRYELDETLRRWEQMLDGFIEHVEALGD